MLKLKAKIKHKKRILLRQELTTQLVVAQDQLGYVGQGDYKIKII